MEIKKYGAIDIGSNAIRLLIANVIVKEGREPQFKKSSLVRVPIRLGADSFVKGIITEENIKRMLDAMEAFKLLMRVHNVERYKACATSAMREAKNGVEVVDKIFEETGVKIDIIGGKDEAAIISSTDLSELISGTVRLLNNKKAVNKEIFANVEKWIKKNTKDLKNLSLIGSGGNINKLFKMSGRTEGKPISYIYLNAQYLFLKQMSYQERISELSLNPDRADVIIPAAKIYLSAMKWSGARKIYVPKIGLSDGIIKSLFYNKL